jgi:hypothetical protein
MPNIASTSRTCMHPTTVCTMPAIDPVARSKRTAEDAVADNGVLDLGGKEDDGYAEDNVEMIYGDNEPPVAEVEGQTDAQEKGATMSVISILEYGKVLNMGNDDCRSNVSPKRHPNNLQLRLQL